MNVSFYRNGEGFLKRSGDRLGKSTRIFTLYHRERLSSHQSMAGKTHGAKQPGMSFECVFRKYRVSKATFHQPLDYLCVRGFHNHARDHSNLLKEAVNNGAHIARFGIEQKRSV